ncbi:MAG: hypothetical protein WCS69_00340 [Ignavibacteriaceae bacterium]
MGSFLYIGWHVNFLSLSVAVEGKMLLNISLSLLISETPEVFTTSTDLTPGTPNHFVHYLDYSTLFYPVTKINFDLIATYLITLKVYNNNHGGGKTTLINNEGIKPGSYSVAFNGNNLSNGIYIYVHKTYKFTALNKMTLLK